ncbi:hypothetical protein TUBRATIS_14350 [Tubulinosema ratisbonensis]|uniref:RRM domain-containing protein n=1 Tax=Tubulinosema ratisbonensis TaxID=291195 RepID=A0A437ALW1_9MICR|nr:hypothetical protein TUBRATIS_14350 [Tubulinosema ratisbonensis]
MSQSIKRLKRDEDLKITSTRTICISNISSKEEQNLIKQYISDNSDVFEIYTINEDIYSVLFVIFYDIKTSEKIFDHFVQQGKTVLYTISKYEIPRTPDKCDSSKNQGTLLVMGRDLSEPLQEEDLLSLFEPFGKIRVIKDFKAFQKYIEFDDTRSALNALNSIDNCKFKDGFLSLKPSWDISINKRWDFIKEIDGLLSSIKIKQDNNEKKEEKGSKIYEKSVFLKALDDFIVENLSHIEKWL